MFVNRRIKEPRERIRAAGGGSGGHSFLIILFWLYTLTGIAQSTFSIRFKQLHTAEGIGMVIENDAHDFIGVGAKSDNVTMMQIATLWAISKNGDTLTREYHFADSSAGFLYIEQNLTGGYYVVGTISNQLISPPGPYPAYYYNHLVLELDNNFNIIHQKVTVLPGMETIYGWKIKKLLHHYYIITATSGNNSMTTWVGDPYFIKLDENFDTIQIYHAKIGGSQAVDDFIFSQDSSKIFLFGTSYIPLPNGTGGREMVMYDTNFNYLGYKLFTDIHLSEFRAKWLSDNTFIIGCNKSTTPDHLYDQCFLLSDSALTIYKQTQMGIQDTNDWCATNITFDFSTTDSIFYTGIKNGVPSFWINEPSWIRIGMINSNLDHIYERFYGGDGYYAPQSILKTTDGGVLVYSAYFDLTNPDYSSDIFILKLNSEGLITGTKQNDICPYLPFGLYPNPGFTLLNLNLVLNKAVLKISDIQGKMLHTQEIFFGKTTIDCSKLNAGIYMISVTNQNSEIFTQKWIKY